MTEVLELEDVGTTFRSSSNHLGRVNLDEVILDHELSVKAANSRLKLEDSLISWNSQVDDSIVESDILLDNDHLLAVLLLLVTSSSILSCLIGNQATCIVNLER